MFRLRDAHPSHQLTRVVEARQIADLREHAYGHSELHATHRPFDCMRLHRAEIRSSLVYGRLMADDVKRRVSAERVDPLGPVRRS